MRISRIFEKKKEEKKRDKYQINTFITELDHDMDQFINSIFFSLRLSYPSIINQKTIYIYRMKFKTEVCQKQSIQKIPLENEDNNKFDWMKRESLRASSKKKVILSLYIKC